MKICLMLFLQVALVHEFRLAVRTKLTLSKLLANTTMPANDKPAAESCQYAGIKGKRPSNSVLVSVCLKKQDKHKQKLAQKCVRNARTNYASGFLKGDGKVVQVKADEFTIGDCERLCTENLICDDKGCKKIPELKGGCRGYVVREPFLSTPQSKPQCWLIPNDAPMSKTFPDEVKLAKLTMHEYGKQTPKKLFLKEQCNCGNRYVHVTREPLRTRLEILKAKLRGYADSLADAEDTPINASKNSVISEEEATKNEVDSLTEHLHAYEEVAKLAGVYDYLPVYIPHRVERGYLNFLPTGVIKTMSSMGSLISGEQKQVGTYWQGPVRITNIYKKMDFSSILYKCLDKSARTEFWYIVRREALITEIKTILQMGGIAFEDQEGFPGIDSADLDLILTIFFKARCFGHKIGEDGTIHEFGSHMPTPYKIDSDFLRHGPGQWGPADGTGCFKNAQKAAKKEEELVIADILNSDLEGTRAPEDTVDPLPELVNGICEELLTGQDNAIIKKMSTAENVMKYQGALNVAAAAGEIAVGAYNGVKNWLSGWGRGTTTTTTADVDKVGEVNRRALLQRTKELIEAMKQILIRISAIEASEDEQLKLFCAKEMLLTVQNAGGIWPKISQNLAVRPDLVKDDYARNKLKETQSGNADHGREQTLAFIAQLDPAPSVEFPSESKRPGKWPITDFMEYDRFLSAGSVGQVDLWTLRTDLPEARIKAQEFLHHVLPADWTGSRDKFIVKTVFTDTEELYRRDWKLMSLFFGKLGGYLPAKFSSVWDVLKNLEGSIFDEFDLRKEAQFTQRGRAMLKTFSANNPNGPRVTTPVGLETESKYVMIQTLAPGKPLSDYLEQVKGQWDRLAEWRTDIYSTILKVFGFTAIQNGFFQADPHPGNWFWDDSNRALTLIDWGGVEDWTEKEELKQAHCTLAQLYSTMGTMSPRWESCESVILDPALDSRGNPSSIAEIEGTYNRHGVSIHKAAPGEDELLMGFTYAYTYKHVEKPLTLWYDGLTWVVSEIKLGTQDVTFTKAKMIAARKGRAAGQSFFGLAFGRAPEELTTADIMVSKWAEVDNKNRAIGEFDVTVSSGRTLDCLESADRTQAYQMAAQRLGINLNSDCEKLRFLDTTADARLVSEMNTDPIILVCIHKDDNKALKARLGVPPTDYDVYDAGSGNLFVKIPLPNKGGEDVHDEKEIVEFALTGETSIEARKALKQAENRIHRPAVHLSSLISSDGVGAHLGWQHSPLGTDGAGDKIEVVALDQAQRGYAIAAALFDSDVAELAVMGLQGRQSLSVFQPGEAPEVYTLFARCAIVFHGMVMDVITENLMRLVPIDKLQWLLQPHGDRFFKVWKNYADAYLENDETTCSAGRWDDVTQTGQYIPAP
eukprot:CAMPEP_0169344732 /NCGR_PEP_ID=MMETSP1017-20121227/21197_1 /TAXON_ID=342587 /ORGANISM="Karlodinium micrum, Strain CCMP2283" /LENGTH=1373 /DNA_ID=CAMNT_0009440535 /DNA_START=16 /DNA_END=4137 /DNA_ORIENTATION=+